MMSSRKALRALLARPGYHMAPGAYDPLTARLVEAAGFSVVYVTGGGFSRANGFPDMGLLTLTEVTAGLARIVDSVRIPVIADMDSGYGNAINVVRAVREFERAGVSAFHLEDQVSPKKCGHYEGKALVSAAEMIGKIKAAVDTRTDADMTIIARSDARAVEGLEAAIERVNRYLDAGADLGFVEAPQSVEELAKIPPALNGPAVANIFEGGKTPLVPARELERMGFTLGWYPSQTQRAAIKAAQRVLKLLKDTGGATEVERDLASFNEREAVVGTPEWREKEHRYVRSVEP
jgi:2-methylisocitrate lyase-like PEP mutase family enzyme